MKLLPILAGAAALIVANGASASDLLIGGADPIYNSPLFNFEGFYVGGSIAAGDFTSTGRAGAIGVVAGANFAVTDGVVAGVEFQGDAIWGKDGIDGAGALFLGKLGGFLTDSTMVYATAGAGWIVDEPTYAFGLGIEQALTDQLSIRGEAMATGAFGGGFDGGKLSGSLLWHMN